MEWLGTTIAQPWALDERLQYVVLMQLPLRRQTSAVAERQFSR